MIKLFAMKKIQSALIGLFLVPFFLCMTGRMTAQNEKSVNCANSMLSVVQGVDKNECYYDVTLYLNYSTTNTDPRACPHGIYFYIENASITRVGNWSPNVWFNSAVQSPKPITPNLQQICFSRICDWTAATATARYANILRPFTLYRVRIYAQPDPNFTWTKVTLKLVQGYSYVPGGSGPSCNVFDCYNIFTYNRPANPYSLVCTKPLPTPPACDLCPPLTAGDEVLKLTPDPPAGSTILWYKMPLPSNGICTSFPSGGLPLPFHTQYNCPSTGVTCPTGILPVSTCFVAVVNSGCNSYFVKKTILVCRPLSGIGITATSISPYPPLQFISGNWHACNSWKGMLSIPPGGINCPTTIRWEYWNGFTWVPKQSYLYDPFAANPLALSCPTGLLQYAANTYPCYKKFSFRVVLSNNICPTVSSTINIYIDKTVAAGSISAAPDLVGSGTQAGPIFCEKGYTSLTYSGACTEVNKWEKSESTDPCGLGTTWGPWTDIPQASSGTSPSYFTNLLIKTTRYRVLVHNYACDPVYSNPITVRIIPALSVTLTVVPPCPNICYGTVTLTASVPCPAAHNPLIYKWYGPVGLISGATSDTYNPTDAGDYYVTVTSPYCGTKQSNKIKVCGAPTVTISGPCAICPGQTALLHPVVTGCCLQPPFLYAWNNTATSEDIVIGGPGNYTVTVTAGNCIVVASKVVIECPSTGFVCGNSFTDSRDGHLYNTVQIGSQCWMKENLDVGDRIDGDLQQTDNNQIEKYCYDNLPVNCSLYGGLYLWEEMMDYAPSTTGIPLVQGICPAGWHVPSNSEWCTMENTLDATVSCVSLVTGLHGFDIGGKLKAVTGWSGTNVGATNSSWFTALPGGYRRLLSGNYFAGKKYYAYFWSATEFSSQFAWGRSLSTYHKQVYLDNNYDKNPTISLSSILRGFSVRCIKD
jgi:uncharacterized protein (TIGR02145 family)